MPRTKRTCFLLLREGAVYSASVHLPIRAIDHDILLIFETLNELGTKVSHIADPIFGIRQAEAACWFLGNCDTITPQIRDFQIPGN